MFDLGKEELALNYFKKPLGKAISCRVFGSILLTIDLHEIFNLIQAYPASNAVILRHHGIHVWGENWKKAKLMAEAYHYMLDLAVEMHKLGINEYTNV